MSERDDRPVQVEIEGDRWSWFYVCGECHRALSPEMKKCPGCGRRLIWGTDETNRPEMREEHVQALEDWEKSYMAGYQYGYQMAIKDVIKKLRGMKWYGGDKPEKRADGVPEHYAGRAADLQRKL